MICLLASSKGANPRQILPLRRHIFSQSMPARDRVAVAIFSDRISLDQSWPEPPFDIHPHAYGSARARNAVSLQCNNLADGPFQRWHCFGSRGWLVHSLLTWALLLWSIPIILSLTVLGIAVLVRRGRLRWSSQRGEDKPVSDLPVG
jgi:hypothetical protein